MAVAESVNVALILVALETTMFPTVTPLPLKPMLEPETKFAPVNTTATAVPWVPLEGVTDDNVGFEPAGVTSNTSEPLTPAAVATDKV